MVTDGQTGRQEMKESDYAEGTGDAATKLSVHCLSTHLYNAFMQLPFSLAANFKCFHLHNCCHQETVKTLTV